MKYKNFLENINAARVEFIGPSVNALRWALSANGSTTENISLAAFTTLMKNLGTPEIYYVAAAALMILAESDMEFLDAE